MTRPSDEEFEDAVRTMLRYIGDDPEREGVLDTPKRVRKAWVEMLAGREWSPEHDLSRVFELDDEMEATTYDGIVLLTDIDFFSFCEHHILPIEGVAHVAYIPEKAGRVVGISKLARVVRGFARRLQTQERMNDQIADALHRHLRPLGVLAVIEAAHGCMRARGVRTCNTVMTTSSVRGVFAEDASAKAEAMALIQQRMSRR